ncbi:hypothetical protein [Nocardioides sp. Kera G14]|uniref:hypothetical protein n=1 Tax=Nocardioides sp. Kera G14 TaxID=2884264 RepID=UPI001D122524|nr:hypothetical protein [Nocardioides sp. Kera G14]UDY23945.1 hypothetical protein LH076_01200 [Nocardioides sp. Kera G14]
MDEPDEIDEPWSVETTLATALDLFRADVTRFVGLAALPLLAISVISLPFAFFLPSLGEDGISGRLSTAFVAGLTLALVIVLGAPLGRAALLEAGHPTPPIAWPRMLAVGATVGAICGLGLALWLLPGLVAAVLLYSVPVVALATGNSPVEAVREALQLTARHPGPVLVWAVLALMMTFAGGCLCLIGFLAAYPVATLGSALTYRTTCRTTR